MNNTETFTLELEFPLTKEQLAIIRDDELEHTTSVYFTTPKGKRVEFKKIVYAKWEDQYKDGNWHCTNCGAIVEKDEQINHVWNFCYHCGAIMGNAQCGGGVMPRYIDAEKIAEHKFPFVAYDHYVSDGKQKSDDEIYAYKVGYNEAISSIEQFAPTANVVEVVRCNDCKHRDDDGMCRGRGWPMQLVPDDGFCDKGERREDE